MAKTKRKKVSTKKPKDKALKKSKTEPKAKATPKPKAKPKAKQEEQLNIAEIDLAILGKEIEKLEDEFDLTANTLVARKRTSTGILALDMQWGGGVMPGSYTIAGVEKSGKSTIITKIFGRMVREKVPVCQLRDAEGTVGVDIDYTRALLGDNVNISKLMGSSDISGKEEVYKPRIHVEQSIEKTYEFFRAVLDLLPDKMYSTKDSCWLFKAPNTKKGVAQMSLLGPKAEIFKRKKAKKEYLYAYANSDLIGFIAIDSYPALMPDSVEEEGKKGGRLSQEAASFSHSLPLIVGRLVKKGFVVLGAQQLRQDPMNQYQPWREPGGNALKQYSQVREWLHAISPSSIKTTPALWNKGESPLHSLCKEKSVEEPGPNQEASDEAYDYYQMIYLQNKKNKTATPLNRVEMRIWTRDRHGFGRGVDPVFDTWFYLVNVVGATVRSRRVTCEKFFGSKNPYFRDFKRLIIAEEYQTDEELKKAWKKIDSKAEPVRIREWCFQDLRERTNADAKIVEKGMFDGIES